MARAFWSLCASDRPCPMKARVLAARALAATQALPGAEVPLIPLFCVWEAGRLRRLPGVAATADQEGHGQRPGVSPAVQTPNPGDGARGGRQVGGTGGLTAVRQACARRRQLGTQPSRSPALGLSCLLLSGPRPRCWQDGKRHSTLLGTHCCLVSAESKVLPNTWPLCCSSEHQAWPLAGLCWAVPRL